MSFDRDRFQDILQNDPVNGIVLYKSLAKTLAGRLIETYRVLAESSIANRSASLGSGQFGVSNADDGLFPETSSPAAAPSPSPTQQTAKVTK